MTSGCFCSCSGGWGSWALASAFLFTSRRLPSPFHAGEPELQIHRRWEGLLMEPTRSQSLDWDRPESRSSSAERWGAAGRGRFLPCHSPSE